MSSCYVWKEHPCRKDQNKRGCGGTDKPDMDLWGKTTSVSLYLTVYIAAACCISFVSSQTKLSLSMMWKSQYDSEQYCGVQMCTFWAGLRVFSSNNPHWQCFWHKHAHLTLCCQITVPWIWKMHNMVQRVPTSIKTHTDAWSGAILRYWETLLQHFFSCEHVASILIGYACRGCLKGRIYQFSCCSAPCSHWEPLITCSPNSFTQYRQCACWYHDDGKISTYWIANIDGMAHLPHLQQVSPSYPGSDIPVMSWTDIWLQPHAVDSWTTLYNQIFCWNWLFFHFIFFKTSLSKRKSVAETFSFEMNIKSSYYLCGEGLIP